MSDDLTKAYWRGHLRGLKEGADRPEFVKRFFEEYPDPDPTEWDSEHPDFTTMAYEGRRPVMLGDGERVHVVDAINEYLVTQDVPEEAQSWWAAIKLKLLEGVE